jgi:hypothetical protein
MKVNGKRPTAYSKTLVLPRGDGQDPIVFVATAIQNMDDFDKLAPEPEPPLIRGRGDSKVQDFSDAAYLQALEQQVTRRTDYIVLKSLEGSPGLEWERTSIKDVNTWNNWRKEVEEAGLCLFEVRRIIALCSEVNSLSDAALDAAQKRFLAGQAAVTQ